MDQKLTLRPPLAEDGMPVFELVKQCPPLDVNSAYCNLLQATHFSKTSVAADLGDELVGFVSGYQLPDRDDTLFIWQVAVSEKVRGQGVASQLIEHILARPHCQAISFIETTITESNQASWALFESLAKRYQTTLNRTVMFDCDQHFNGEHDSEWLARIGPLK